MIRKLGAADWTAWKSIRLESLNTAPEAFSATYEEACKQSDDEWAKDLIRWSMFAAFEENTIIGVVGYIRWASAKTRHRAEVFGTYLKSAYRGKGIMGSLMDTLAQHARESGIEQLHLEASDLTPKAIECYKRNGYTVYGIKPRTIKIDNHYNDTQMMVKFL